jgi:hypothetical protein
MEGLRYIDEEGNQVEKETQKQFYGRLAAALMDNKEDTISTRERTATSTYVDVASMPAIEANNGRRTSGIGPQFTPTKRKRKMVTGHCRRLLCCLFSKYNTGLFYL